MALDTQTLLFFMGTGYEATISHHKQAASINPFLPCTPIICRTHLQGILPQYFTIGFRLRFLSVLLIYKSPDLTAQWPR